MYYRVPEDSTKFPKVNRVRETIRRQILGGALSPGAQLPSEKQLASTLGVNHQTVRRGLATLVDEGLIVKQPRVGNFVATGVSQQVSIALLVPDYLQRGLASSLYPLFVSGLQEQLDPRCHTLTTMTYRPGHMWEDAGQLVADHGVRGVAMISSQVQPDEVGRFTDQGISVVLLHQDATLAGTKVHRISADFGGAMIQIIERLRDWGHDRLRIVRYATSTTWSQVSQTLDLVWDRYFDAPAEEVLVKLPNAPAGWDAAPLRALFDKSRMPTAIVVPDESVAGATFRLCYERGVRVPEDLSIVALADHTPHLHPVPLSGGDGVTARRQIASAAGQRLTQLLSGEQVVGTAWTLSLPVHWKASAGPCAPEPTRAPSESIAL